MIIVSVGERAMDSGEAKSKVDINVDANQQRMVKEIKEATQKPVITLVMGGRPFNISQMEPLYGCYSFHLVVGYGGRQCNSGCTYRKI